MSTANDSDYDVEPIPRAAIDINIGTVNVIAILDDSFLFNAVHETVFKRICEEEDEDDNQTYENITIELDMSIDDRPVTGVFRVLPDLWADMVMGEDFFVSVKAHIHLELGLFKWSYEDELVSTEMVENYENFRALSGGSCASNGAKSSEKEESAVSQEPSTSSKKKKKRRNKSKKNNDSSISSYSIDSQLQQLTLGTNDLAKENPKKDEFVKIFIAERNLWDEFDKEYHSYYGIYSSQVDISVVKGEVLDAKKNKTPLGYHLEAIRNAFYEANKQGVTRLHVVSENEDAIKVMIADQKKYEEGSVHYSPIFGISGFESLKLEHIPWQDIKFKEMVHVRKLVEKYIETVSI